MRRLLIIPLLLFLAALIAAGWKCWQQAHAWDQATQQLITRLDAGGRLEMMGEQMLEAITLGLYRGHSKEISEIRRLQSQQRAYRESAWQLATLFFILVTPTLMIAYLVRNSWLDCAYAMLGVALICLVLGLTIPILSISISKELPLIGETVLQFQSKGILSTIAGLWSSKNHWLAVLLFLFSVLIPFTKTLLVGVTLFARTHHLFEKGLHWSRSVGKWSMADVFVVAILVVFFANEGDGITQSEVQVGLGFFTGYVLLAILGTHMVSQQLGSLKSP